MKNKFSGEQLKIARTYRGLTTEELAQKIGVKKQTISLYETDKIIPEVENLFKIIKELNFPRQFFFQNKKTIPAGTPYFRALLTTNKKYREQQKLQNQFRAQLCEYLLKYMDFPVLNIPYNIDFDGDIEAFSLKIREFWGLGLEAITNIIHLLEKQGLIVLLTKTDTDDIDAFNQSIQINDEERYIVTLSKNKPSFSRIQFDAAHELGHILLHPKSEDIEAISREEFKFLEKQANEFAASFLLPKEAFIKDLPERYRYSLDYYVRLKKKWNVSISAMIIRAYNLNLMTYNQYQYLMKKMSQKGWKTHEPYDDSIIIPEPTMLKYAIDLLLDNNIHTVQSLLEDISVDLALNSDEIEFLLGLEKGKLAIPDTTISNIKPKLKV